MLKVIGGAIKDYFKKRYKKATLKNLIKDNVKFNLMLGSAIEGYKYLSGERKPVDQVAKNLTMNAVMAVPQGIAEYILTKKIFKL